jgi:D-tyrosyl-tRNA(Tyr) deacylase
MKAVLQRVDYAKVRVKGRQIAGIGKGLLVFLGVARGDTKADAGSLLDKIIHLRIFEDEAGKMNLSLSDTGGQLLIVSQFTLLADCRKGRRPSFTEAERPDAAREMVRYFVKTAEERYGRVASGEFQAMMEIEMLNNGPVTILLESGGC